MVKPTFVCVPGAWHTPSTYTLLIKLLNEKGYDAIAVTLPSVGCKPVTYDFSEDVEAIRSTITKFVEEGKDVIPVLHSYGGMCGGQALEGLGREEREERGLSGGVVRVVYIMAMMLPEGAQPASRGSTENMHHFMEADLEAGIVTVLPADAVLVFYNDLPKEQADKLASELESQSIGVFWSTVTYAPWRKIRTTYVLCENDQSFTMAFAEHLLNSAKATDNHRIDTLERCDAGHFVMISRPEWLVGVLKRAAGARVG